MKTRAAALALAGLLAGCSGGRAPAPPAATSTPSPTPSDSSDLAALLPATPPTGYTVVENQSGPLTLDEAAADDDDPEAERKRLSENGFRRGYARTWQSETGDIIILIVDEFGSDAGAGREYDASIAEAAQTGATRFTVDGIEGATGLTQTDEGTTFHAVAFARGSRLFVAAVGGTHGTHEPPEAVAWARKILALL